MSSVSQGFRFHPSDEELVKHYLMRKTSSPDFSCFIRTMPLFDNHPWTHAHVKDPYFGQYEWYYFVEKNPNGHKHLWKEGETHNYSGWWKKTEDLVMASDEDRTTLGRKARLHYFYYDQKKRKGTGWVIDEFTIEGDERWALCHLMFTDWDAIFDRPYCYGCEDAVLEWGILKEIHQSLISGQGVAENEDDTYGFRFYPTDKELVTLYLAPKNSSPDFISFIEESKIYAKEPWLLPLERSALYKENEWYFFVKKAWSRREERNLLFQLDDKKKNWHINGESKKIIDHEICIATKTIFSFNVSDNLLSRSGWKVEEYRLPSRSDYALCKLTYVHKLDHKSTCTVHDQPVRLTGDHHPHLQWQMLKSIHEASVADDDEHT